MAEQLKLPRPIDDQTEVCPRCDGTGSYDRTGKITAPCPDCRGLGAVPLHSED